jgi:predicted membrane protein
MSTALIIILITLCGATLIGSILSVAACLKILRNGGPKKPPQDAGKP